MLFHETLVGLAVATFVAFTRPASAYTIACNYQAYKCGSTLFTVDGYTSAELTTAVNATGVIPPLLDFQLLDVLYRCIDINGTLAGNSYCISGCIHMAPNANDQCAM
ncbi:cellulose signaling related protein ooc1 [Niveomyces insectorum RCEF 264]|uniref:Cellulose signaling related protein ooc1 n=1 Tax=Niveomyces insectorum RCEF 264 TaxID=1081102 RepID=A0A167UJM3_9HYPO|nr:cellulose signaling related protein ooc1 [Niveomyces insectorum RCEF 264]